MLWKLLKIKLNEFNLKLNLINIKNKTLTYTNNDYSR